VGRKRSRPDQSREKNEAVHDERAPMEWAASQLRPGSRGGDDAAKTNVVGAAVIAESVGEIEEEKRYRRTSRTTDNPPSERWREARSFGCRHVRRVGEG
jgi:hypothetical protein